MPAELTRLVVSAAFVVAGSQVEASPAEPRLLCYPVTHGETVARISFRLTRDPQSWRGSGFQMFDPATATFVPKADYRHIDPRWRACVAESLLVRAATLPRTSGPMRWWPLLLVVGAAVVWVLALESSLDRRAAASRMLRTYGAAFIREFERPLVDVRSSRLPLRTSLVLSHDRRTLEVLLAPAEGRLYPNLADHRANVEYDVRRVVALLNDRRFICGPLRARGSWVAIPFRLDPDLRKEGGT